MLKSLCLDRVDGLIDYNTEGLLSFNNIVIDSRIVSKNDAFVGLKGEHVDGNEYAFEAYKKGASFSVVDNREIYSKLIGNKVLVRDSFNALKSIGLINIRKFDGLIIAVTGSAGKTSTKELISIILAEKYKVYKSFKNNNNALGIALNCANLDLESDVAIFECGTNTQGEISALANYLLPRTVVITNIGYSHIGRFGTIEKLAEEKLSITSPLSVKELWINIDDYTKYRHLIDDRIDVKTFSYVKNGDAYLYINNIEQEEDKVSMSVVYKGSEYRFSLNHFFIHLAYDALPAIGIAFGHGLDSKLINKGLAQFEALAGRGQIISFKNLRIIDDTYNASYNSIVAAINSLSSLKGIKVAILGTMAEIDGYENLLYNKLYEYILTKKSVYSILVGDEYKRFEENEHIKIVENKRKAIESIKTFLNDQNKAYAILLKGARKNTFEDIVEFIMKMGEIQSVI
jgi:UDP-N-acetylmuramoyl-tripeptide--D-alanyl-D-alanine ligase